KDTPRLALGWRRLRFGGISHPLCLCTIAHATASVRETIGAGGQCVRKPIFRSDSSRVSPFAIAYSSDRLHARSTRLAHPLPRIQAFASSTLKRSKLISEKHRPGRVIALFNLPSSSLVVIRIIVL